MPHDDRTAVARLYERLTEALQRTRREPFNVPVTVAEIYQELVPYRLVRAEMGFDMNADYEHALLRLLGGEGECVRIEPPNAAEEIRRELRNANPNLSIYRNYAACDVWVRKPAPRTEPQAGSAAAPAAAIRDHTFRSAADPVTERPVRSLAEPEPVAERPARSLADAAPVTERPMRSVGEPAPQRTPPDRPRQQQTSASTGGGGPGPAKFGLPRTDRSDDHEDRVDGAALSLSAMSEKPKREPAPGGEATGSRPPMKSPPAANPPHSTLPSSPNASAAVPQPAAPAARPAAVPQPTAPAARPTAVPQPATPTARPTAAPTSALKAGAHARPAEPARCAFCDSTLPQQRSARFCPYCGADQTTRPCPSCGEAVEPGWAFCIACGATAQ